MLLAYKGGILTKSVNMLSSVVLSYFLYIFNITSSINTCTCLFVVSGVFVLADAASQAGDAESSRVHLVPSVVSSVEFHGYIRTVSLSI